MATPSINTVPADLVLDIMARLPVKSLMRLRLISKSFFSDTAAPNFITSHLALPKSSGYVALPSRFWNPPQSSVAILDKSFSEVLRPQIPFSFPPRPEPEFLFKRKCRVECIYYLVGSCNGLLCVADIRTDYLGCDVFLWNPMIGKFKSISGTSLNPNMLRDTTTRITLGFWFDEKNDDYKIIRIAISPHKTESAHAEIYSLKTNSWKRVIFPINYLDKNLLIESYNCAFLHGALHWLVYLPGHPRYPVIFSFNIDDEQFKEIRLPQNYRKGSCYCSADLMVLKESLALTVFDEVMEDEVGQMCRVWTMNKYEEVESWTVQFLPITQISYIYGFTEEGGLLFSQNDEDFEVSLYNLDTGTLKESFMLEAECIVPFRESLVLL